MSKDLQDLAADLEGVVGARAEETFEGVGTRAMGALEEAEAVAAAVVSTLDSRGSFGLQHRSPMDKSKTNLSTERRRSRRIEGNSELRKNDVLI